jgi:uncharacterized protein
MAGGMVHLEIPASDTAKAKDFWSSLFGWEWQQYEGPSEYHMTRFSETTGGALYVPEQGGDRVTRVYFDVDDINAANARVKELGGEGGEPQPVPGMGWFSNFKDTEGNEFGLWQSDPGATAPGQ